jgi:hypothetical protein
MDTRRRNDMLRRMTFDDKGSGALLRPPGFYVRISTIRLYDFALGLSSCPETIYRSGEYKGTIATYGDSTWAFKLAISRVMPSGYFPIEPFQSGLGSDLIIKSVSPPIAKVLEFILIGR